MANLTLAIDDDVLKRARIKALEQGTSVNALVRDYLTELAGESEAAAGMAAFLAAVSGTGAGSGGRNWTRDELYDRT